MSRVRESLAKLRPRPGAVRRAGRALRRGAVRVFRRSARYRIVRDTVGAFVIVGIIVLVLSFFTGGKWPPILVIESGSMMHGQLETPYGRIGTIDVGDMIFVRDVEPEDVRTWAEGGPDRYGRPGDVILYLQNGDGINTTIVHRAIARVDVLSSPQGYTYRLHWTHGQILEFGPQGIYFPRLGFSEEYGFTPTNGYRPEYSGFLTKGDNAQSNPIVDQAMGLSRIVDPAWIQGRAMGEIPWMGLGKLMAQSGKTNPEGPGYTRVGNAFAPVELWSCFFVVTAAGIILPFILDTARAIRQERRRERLEEQEAAKRRAATAAPPPPPPRRPPREPVEFRPVSR